MRKNILIAIFAISFMAIIAILFLIARGDENTQQIVSALKSQIATKTSSKQTKPTWTSELANVDKKNYQYPVNDLFMQINLNEKKQAKIAKKLSVPKAKESYKLVVDRSDRYSLFCIRETLKYFSLPYIIVKETGKSYIAVGSEDKNELQKVHERLKKYNIKSKIQKVQI